MAAEQLEIEMSDEIPYAIESQISGPGIYDLFGPQLVLLANASGSLFEVTPKGICANSSLSLVEMRFVGGGFDITRKGRFHLSMLANLFQQLRSLDMQPLPRLDVRLTGYFDEAQYQSLRIGTDPRVEGMFLQFCMKTFQQCSRLSEWPHVTKERKLRLSRSRSPDQVCVEKLTLVQRAMNWPTDEVVSNLGRYLTLANELVY